MAFLGDKMIDEEETEHPPHTELVFRCKDIGKYSLIGSIRRRCTHGDWDGVKPTCYGLSQENDYACKCLDSSDYFRQIMRIFFLCYLIGNN